MSRILLVVVAAVLVLSGCTEPQPPSDAEVAASVAESLADLDAVRSVEVEVIDESSRRYLVKVRVEAAITDDEIRAMAGLISSQDRRLSVSVNVTDGEARWSQFAGTGDVTEPLIWLRADGRFTAVNVNVLSAGGAVPAAMVLDAATDYHAAMVDLGVTSRRLLVEESEVGVGEYHKGFEIYVDSERTFPQEAAAAVAAFDASFPAGNSYVELLEGDDELDVRVSAARDDDLAAALVAADAVVPSVDGKLAVQLGPTVGPRSVFTEASMPFVFAAAAIPELAHVGFGTARTTASGAGDPSVWLRVNDLVAAELDNGSTIWKFGETRLRSPALEATDPLRQLIPALLADEVVQDLSLRALPQGGGSRELSVRLDAAASSGDLTSALALLADVPGATVILSVLGDDGDVSVATIDAGVLMTTGEPESAFEQALEEAWAGETT
ncbi:MAG: hypothetical protein ABI566_11870 [Pseudolysinimonas sp.]